MYDCTTDLFVGLDVHDNDFLHVKLNVFKQLPKYYLLVLPRFHVFLPPEPLLRSGK